MKGDKKTVLSPSRCLILCAAAAVAAMLLLSAAVELANVLARPLGVSLLSVNFPVSALICCFAVLLGARLVAAHKRLKDDNDLFV